MNETVYKKIEQFEAQAQDIYEMARSEGLWQNKKDVPFTGFDIFLSQYQKFWNPNQNNVVVFSWEICYYSVLLGDKVEKLTFVSDADWKTKVLKQYLPGIKIINYNYTQMMKFTKKFDGGFINPPFDQSEQMRRIMENLCKSPFGMIIPTRDLLSPKSCARVGYFKYLGHAFKENIVTALMIIDPNKQPITTIVEDMNNNIVKIKDFIHAPGKDLQAWLFARKVLSLKLPGFEARNGNGKLDYSKAKDTKNGVLCVFTVGERDKPNEFGKTKRINKDQLRWAVGLGEHNLIWSKTGELEKLSACKYAGPDVVHGFGTLSIRFSSKKEVFEAIDYIENTEEVKKLVRGIKTATVVNGINIWKKIPHYSFKDKWISIK